MARTPTPIMLFAKVITVPVLVPIVISKLSNLLYNTRYYYYYYCYYYYYPSTNTSDFAQ